METPWKSLSVFFPVYNEAAALEKVVGRSLEVLRQWDVPEFELIIVDDGSTDGTRELADRLAANDQSIKVIHHERNMGYGSALVTGLAAARFEWVAYTDGDGQFDLSDLQKFMEPSKRVDVVLGYRSSRQDHAGRKLNAWLWSRCVNMILGLKVRDVDCGFKLFKTGRIRSLGRLEARGAVISAELLLRLRSAGCDWVEVAVRHFPRQGGVPSGANPKVILRAISELLRLRRRLRSLPPAA